MCMWDRILDKGSIKVDSVSESESAARGNEATPASVLRRCCLQWLFFYILRCYFNELDAKSMYRHGIICSEKTHIYFKGRILSTFLKMSFLRCWQWVTLCLRLRSYRNYKTCRTWHASKINPLRGFAKLKKFQKSKNNLDRAQPTHPPPYPNNFFFGNPSVAWPEHSNHNCNNIQTEYITLRSYQMSTHSPHWK